MRANNLYDGNNLRFRRAVIRERLSGLKSERDALVAERNTLDRRERLIKEAKAAANVEIKPYFARVAAE